MADLSLHLFLTLFELFPYVSGVHEDWPMSTESVRLVAPPSTVFPIYNS